MPCPEPYTHTSSPSSNASSTSCVTRMIPMPIRACKVTSSNCICSRVMASRAANGSSRAVRAAIGPISERAKPAVSGHRKALPESDSSRPESPVSVSMSRARARRAAMGYPRPQVRSPRFSSAVSHGTARAPEHYRPDPGRGQPQGLPSSVTVPASGASNPARIFNNVVLPHPEVPIRANTPPRGIATDTPGSTSRDSPPLRKDFHIPEQAKKGFTAASGSPRPPTAPS